MQEASTEHYIQPVSPDSYNTLDSEGSPSLKEYSNFGVQTIDRDPRIALTNKISSQATYIKFLKLWFRFSGNRSKNI